MKDLKLKEDRETLKRILERAIPQTQQDVVLIYAAVTGTRQGELFEETYVKRCIRGRSSGGSGLRFRSRQRRRFVASLIL